ncbi:tryptophan synthase alpha chain [Actinomycetes bacterium]|nr:tryptophan synthase alpha chain [Actinomycetes bacterium]
MDTSKFGVLETKLRSSRAESHKILVPYITGGLTGWIDAIRYAAANGADAVEIGIPFSDPVMDGPIIQQASEKALRDGATPTSIFHELRTVDVQIPLIVMCYYNTVFRAGHERFANSLRDAGVVAAIVPDLPLEESREWCEAADKTGIETIMLAAPTAPDDRLPRVVARARGFVYAVGLLGVTGERSELASTAISMATRLKKITEVPVLVGVGVSNAQQAQQACAVADGVIQGASVVRRLLDQGPDSVGQYVAEVRAAIDNSVVS